ncbi:MAG: hypothetical protein QG555_1763 [Thermodesulfobacteriota bacterium]|nr:hypothetical protein [Thermodesulfobacteriota bacterium]
MAEIKSTLDIIMERTKNLALTEEEKKAIRAKEIKSRVRGWLQRYRDRALIIRDLKENMERERAAFPEVAALLREECLAHLEPEADNGKLFQMMEEILGIDTAPFQRLIDDFNQEISQHRGEATRTALDVLQAQGISGAAVLPNPNLSPAWNARLESAREQFHRKLYLVK